MHMLYCVFGLMASQAHVMTFVEDPGPQVEHLCFT